MIIVIEPAILLCNTNPSKLQSSLPMNNALEIFVTSKNLQIMLSAQSYIVQSSRKAYFELQCCSHILQRK